MMRLGGAMLSPLPNTPSALPLPMVTHAAVHLLPALAAVLKPLFWLSRALAAMVHALCHMLTGGWVVVEESGPSLRRRLLQALLNHFVPGLRMLVEKLLTLLRAGLLPSFMCLLFHLLRRARMLMEKTFLLLRRRMLPPFAHHLAFRLRMLGEFFGSSRDLLRHSGMPLALLSPHHSGIRHQQPTTERTRHEPHPVSLHLALLFRLT